MECRRFCRSSLAFLVLSLLLCAFRSVLGQIQPFHREEIKIPDIPGYITLKCDLHMHTVFSDELVWPTVRVDEAWSEGLDAIAITDHIEFHKHEKDVSTDNDRSYEIALPRAEELSFLLARGGEMTKNMPPGHFNAIFLDDVNKLKNEDFREAFKAARDQNAFIFWNHPWGQNRGEDGLSIWHPEHTLIFENGWMHGIEIANRWGYHPNPHRWALEKNLTILCNTDQHGPMDSNLGGLGLRAMTLVFAREKSLAAIKEALFDRRTAVFVNGDLYGEQRFLEPLFEEAVEVLVPRVTLKGKGSRASVQVRNHSGILFRLAAEGKVEGINFQEGLTLLPEATVLLRVSASGDSLVPGIRTVELPYRVQNMHLSPEETLRITLSLEVTFAAEAAK